MVTVEFGAFTLDTARHQLLEEGRDVHLSLKAYELLRLLVEERPRALAKTELHERLWPDTFVSDSTLASLVAEVREALGDTGRAGRFIRTVHGFGYAFAADVVVRDPDQQVPARAGWCWLTWGSQRCELREGENVLGRDSRASVCIDALSVSRRHARIVLAGGRATVEDLGSRNGTCVGGERLTGPRTLQDGDQISLGTVVLTYRSLVSPLSTVPLE